MADKHPLRAYFGAASIARIGLGRQGDALPLGDVLQFQLAHALARDAVHKPLDIQALIAALPSTPIHVQSQAADRAQYLRRPDLGRRLAPTSHAHLPRAAYDLAIVVADGLSAEAALRHAPALLKALMPRLEKLRIAPLVVATQARVALADEIGAALDARMALILIGERPGLSTPHSLGAYLTYAPQPGRLDSERNCVSNIHENGLSYREAAEELLSLINAALRQRITGVELSRHAALLPPGIARQDKE